MIKSIVIAKRKLGLSREEYIKHYEEVHAPLIIKHLPILRHVRNYIIVPPGAEEPEFDSISESWYADEKALKVVGDILGGTSTDDGFMTPVGKLFRDDTKSFTEGDYRYYFVDERVSTK